MKLPAPAPDMLWIPGGTFLMGSDVHYPEEAPVHLVTVDGFWMDITPVTNADFARFVRETGYVTLSERPLSSQDYPGVPEELLVPGSLVFQQPRGPVALDDISAWWKFIPGADWRHPEGPTSSLDGRERYPVVQVAYEDAEAYANWAAKALPTEAEWEFAARGGLEGAPYAWGDEFAPDGQMLANTWQGTFPWENLATDGYEGLAPAGSFPPNGYGLFDMIGNVWEWTTDWYRARHQSLVAHACCAPRNPVGGTREESIDPQGQFPRKVLKGGSFLCASNYCQRYRPAARSPQAIDSPTCHISFRCIVRCQALD
jgi:formylglycine-generating enzyme